MIGFAIINFSNTFEQSKLMEEKIINFIESCEQNKSHFEETKDKFLLLVGKNKKTKYMNAKKKYLLNV